MCYQGAGRPPSINTIVLALLLRLALAMYNRLGPLSWWSHMFMTLWKLTALVDPCNNRWCLPPHSDPWLSLCMHLKFFTSHFNRSCLQLVHLRQALASKILSALASTSRFDHTSQSESLELAFSPYFPLQVWYLEHAGQASNFCCIFLMARSLWSWSEPALGVLAGFTELTLFLD